MSSVNTVCRDIAQERAAQDEKWGEQNHADGTGEFNSIHLPHSPGSQVILNRSTYTFGWLSRFFRNRCDRMARQKQTTWEHILSEEVFEAYAETNPHHLRKELVQVGAVVVAWIQAIDRRHEGFRGTADEPYLMARNSHDRAPGLLIEQLDHVHVYPGGTCVRNRFAPPCPTTLKEN